MRPSLETQIRERLVDFLVGQGTIDAFNQWLVGATWNIDFIASPPALDLTYAIKIAMAEYTSGLLTGDELRERLTSLATNVRSNFTNIPDARPEPAAGTATPVRREHRDARQEIWADRPLVVGLA